MQLRRLERQQPLVVAEGKRRHGVRTHVLVSACLLAVIGEHGASFGIGQQVPLVRADKRVHADVLARFLTREERRDVALVELCGPVQRHVAPHCVAGTAEDGGPAEIGVGGLDLLNLFRMPPDHEVCVGPQTRDVVHTANHNTFGFERVEELAGVADRLVPIVAQLARPNREDREHEVTNSGVEFCIVQARHGSHPAIARTTRCQRRCVLRGPPTARSATSCRAALSARPTHAGTPTPSKVAPASTRPGGRLRSTSATRDA